MKKKINFYEGYRGEERPKNFLYKGKEIEVKEVLSSAQIASSDPERGIDRLFKVRGNDGKIYKIYHLSEFDEWIVVER
ncbi:MAG: hypothetical protein ACUVUG_05230 [Candidatus Aminicenantia bacterium]